jgi:hypothetical protein
MDYFAADYFDLAYFATPDAPDTFEVRGSPRRRAIPAPPLPDPVGPEDDDYLVWFT